MKTNRKEAAQGRVTADFLVLDSSTVESTPTQIAYAVNAELPGKYWNASQIVADEIHGTLLC